MSDPAIEFVVPDAEGRGGGGGGGGAWLEGLTGTRRTAVASPNPVLVAATPNVAACMCGA